MSDVSLVELFRMEVDSQLGLFTESLLGLEKNGQEGANLEAMMRAAHSIKGAARLVGVRPAEKLAHVMEDCFCAAQAGKIQVTADDVDLFLYASDFLRRISQQPEGSFDEYEQEHQAELDQTLDRLKALAAGQPQPGPAASPSRPEVILRTLPEADPVPRERERTLRLGVDRLDVLVGLAGEVQLATGRLSGLSSAMVSLKRDVFELLELLAKARHNIEDKAWERATHQVSLAEIAGNRCSDSVAQRLDDIETYDRRMYALANRLHQAVVTSRMCAFNEIIGGYPRLVRDLGRELGKEVELVVEGRFTQVDRDVLERIEPPLTQLLRNAVDHGVETPEQRLAAGKPRGAEICLRASHRMGMLAIEVIDDGKGVDLDAVRRSVAQHKLTSQELASRLTREELIEFLYLPSFTTKAEVGAISGRGVGLDVVRTVVMELGGTLQLKFELGKRTQFTMMLPLTLSVSRNLVIEVGAEPYALPLNRVHGVCLVSREEISEVQGMSMFPYRDQLLPLVTCHQVLDLASHPGNSDVWSLVIMGRNQQFFGLAVDRLIGQQDLVVQALDNRFGKLKSVSSGSILENGSPVLLLDVDDIFTAVERICQSGRLENVRRQDGPISSTRTQRILVVDDSITVREVVRKILELNGYDVEVAVDGIDGWHAVRNAPFDLVVSDVDMPRMDGIKLVSAIRSDPQLRSLPIMIVSYKDSEEDKLRGLEAGADFYLTKASFDDNSFVDAVFKLIGGS